MTESTRSPKRSLHLRRATFILAAAWTGVIVLGSVWHVRDVYRSTLESARIQASGSFEKDLVYRRWAAAHGGVYVPVTEETPPNPYLSHIEGRDVTTASGLELTLVNPAYMTRQVHELGRAQYGHQGHITSLHPLRPGNASDAWETEALRAFEVGETEVIELSAIGDTEYLRLMRPMFTEVSCLKCHGDQGYEEGELRGGISVSVPMTQLFALMYGHLANVAVGYGLIWLVGLGGIGLGALRLGRRVRERDRAEEALRQERDFAESLIDTAQVLVLVLDLEGRIVRYNPYMEQVTGYSLAEVQGKDWFNTFLPSRERAAIRELFRQAVGDAQTRGNVNPILTKDGAERQIEWYDKTLRGADGEVVGLLSIGQDVTDRQQLEQEVIHLERMRVSGELAAGVSHNLNNMLTAVLGPAQLLLRKSDDPMIRREADAILHAGRRARDLVTRLDLAVRAGRETPLGPVSVNEQVREAIQMARPRWHDEPESRGVNVELVAELGETPDIRGNSGELGDAILSLLLNAVEAMPEGGVITIATQAVDAGVRLTVRDTGIGMDEETRRRVFEPFFTTKMDVGCGLGLSMVHGTVTRSGGSIEVDSTPGEGTAFTLCLPVWTE